jgi:hypothetical protein
MLAIELDIQHPMVPCQFMSMIGHVRIITPEQLREFRANPGTVRAFVHGKQLANAPMIAGALDRVQKMVMRARDQGETTDAEKSKRLREQILRELASAGVQIPADGPSEEGLSLEKSWHSLHYLLTGSSEPVDSDLGKAILGGKEIGGDVGYGPARFLDAMEVREVAASLSKLSADQLASCFDLKKMMAAHIYACRDEEELELALHYFAQLKDYYAEAAEQGCPMLLYID